MSVIDKLIKDIENYESREMRLYKQFLTALKNGNKESALKIYKKKSMLYKFIRIGRIPRY